MSLGRIVFSYYGTEGSICVQKFKLVHCAFKITDNLTSFFFSFFFCLPDICHWEKWTEIILHDDDFAHVFCVSVLEFYMLKLYYYICSSWELLDLPDWLNPLSTLCMVIIYICKRLQRGCSFFSFVLKSIFSVIVIPLSFLAHTCLCIYFINFYFWSIHIIML